ncbi:SDR family oxidoreductase [Psychrobacillus soli]|uniref:SDR family oxidoreductase n=1 Tax=Psychrobacillus soli TaxID=1543965 RepID=A0A544TL87_9BACI|nr:SDR family oxidoreductase [Psychrobacillus soli]TQR18231.1 SDR family oxidoreductase [Psychrobacillus soli]
MNFSLKGKTAFITGGSRGLGKAITMALSEAGATVAIVSRTESELKKTAEEIEENGGTCHYSAVDVQNREEIEKFAKELFEKTGSIDILVNAAGINRRHSFLEFPEDEWDQVINTNLRSVYIVSQVVIPYMQKQQYGKVINIASLTSELGFPNMAAYAASKGAVSQLTKVLAVEFANDGILVNAIGPGYFKTELTMSLFEDEEKVAWMKSRIPLKRIGVPDELKGTAVFLASSASDYITGQTIYVDGGWLIS